MQTWNLQRLWGILKLSEESVLMPGPKFLLTLFGIHHKLDIKSSFWFYDTTIFDIFAFSPQGRLKFLAVFFSNQFFQTQLTGWVILHHHLTWMRYRCPLNDRIEPVWPGPRPPSWQTWPPEPRRRSVISRWCVQSRRLRRTLSSHPSLGSQPSKCGNLAFETVGRLLCDGRRLGSRKSYNNHQERLDWSKIIY